jgi:hypothetical protein
VRRPGAPRVSRAEPEGGVEVLSMVARRIDSRRSPWRCHAGGQVHRIKGIGGSSRLGSRGQRELGVRGSAAGYYHGVFSGVNHAGRCH